MKKWMVAIPIVYIAYDLYKKHKEKKDLKKEEPKEMPKEEAKK